MYDVPSTDLSPFYELMQNFSTILHTRKPRQKDVFPESEGSKIWSWAYEPRHPGNLTKEFALVFVCSFLFLVFN